MFLYLLSRNRYFSIIKIIIICVCTFYISKPVSKMPVPGMSVPVPGGLPTGIPGGIPGGLPTGLPSGLPGGV